MFVFTDGSGSDRFKDFIAGAGTDDVVDLLGVSTVSDFADIQARASQVGNDTVIDFGNGDIITLVGVAPDQLHQDDFII